eukprot:TRINITY_DN25649_c0_g1_i1.p1 TRINITY_DN25649_c0_g1~~TRINITY_DN25649_c0_g1_i1.p1  ORF type:complete len:994 (-),score=125.80 TRINITY_DN25649_c0_g1_i1:203-3184(-)
MVLRWSRSSTTTGSEDVGIVRISSQDDVSNRALAQVVRALKTRVDYAEAVREGRFLEKHETICFWLSRIALLRRMFSCCGRKRRCFVKVCEPKGGGWHRRESRRSCQIGHCQTHQQVSTFNSKMERASIFAELRWDPHPAKATTEEAEGRVLLFDIDYVSTTSLHSKKRPSEEGCAQLGVRKTYWLSPRGLFSWFCNTVSGWLLSFGQNEDCEFRVHLPSRILTFSAPSHEAAKLWVGALLTLTMQAKGSAMRSLREGNPSITEYVYRNFFKADLDKSNSIQKEELKTVLRNMGITKDNEYIDAIFAEFDTDNSGSLEISEFAELFHTLVVKETLQETFRDYCETLVSSQVDVIRPDRLCEFLEVDQLEAGDGVHLDQVPELWSRAMGRMTGAHLVVDNGETCLTEAGFSEIMCSEANTIFDPQRQQTVFQDMTRPLSHYWIASSHNTYLEGDQLLGTSDLQQYVSVLMRGCRCVEIDVWDSDSGDYGDPMVTHGWTATSRLKFSDVIRVCLDYGFVASEYPLILSLEVHCKTTQLIRIGEILERILGDSLLRLPAGEPFDAMELVSPLAARKMVIVKGRVPGQILPLWRRRVKLSVDTVLMGPEETGNGHLGKSGTIIDSGNKGVSGWLRYLRLQRRPSSDAMHSTQSWNDQSKAVVPFGDENGCCQKGEQTEEVEEEEPKLLDFAKNLYLISCKLSKDHDVYPCNIVSLNEVKAARFVSKNSLDFVREYHSRHVSRVYPHSTRISSDNYDPVPMWLAGFQIVALNYQNSDSPNRFNEGLFFHENGRSGYVLKPPEVLSPCSTKEVSGCRVQLAVLSGHCLPSPKHEVLNPLVRVTVNGMPTDSCSIQTKTVTHNGFNPIWKQSFEFQMTQPSLAMVAFEVVHERSKKWKNASAVVASAAFPFTCLREGIRWVPLWDSQFNIIASCGLLVELRFDGPWASQRRKDRLPQPKSAPLPTDKEITGMVVAQERVVTADSVEVRTDDTFEGVTWSV